MSTFTKKKKKNITFIYDLLGEEKIIEGGEKAALHLAIEKRNIEIVNLLLSSPKINVNIIMKDYKENDIKSIMQIAIESANIDIISLLMNQKGIKISSKDKSAYHDFMTLTFQRMKKLSSQINA